MPRNHVLFLGLALTTCTPPAGDTSEGSTGANATTTTASTGPSTAVTTDASSGAASTGVMPTSDAPTSDAPTTTPATTTTAGQTTGSSDGTTSDGTTGNDATGDGTTGAVEGPTWYGDVLPVAQVRCMGCHRDGGIGPFTMDDVKIAQAYAPLMAAETATRMMPPWMPAAGCQEFEDARVLGQAEIDLFAAWDAAGAPAGDPADAPPPIVPPTLADPDAIIKPVKAYVPDKNMGKDDYHCFALDPKQAGDKQLVAMEFRPGQPNMVHHVLLFAGDRQTILNKDNGGAGWSCYGGPGIGGTPAMVGAWVPGSPVLSFPTGTGVPLLQSQALVMQVHYNFDNIPGPAPADQTEARLKYADAPVTPAQITTLFNSNFSIPAGAVGYGASIEKAMPLPLKVYGIMPHMHQLGRKISLSSATEGCMIDIPAWDFHWQQFYFYKGDKALPLPLKSKLSLSCTWDNPGNQAVKWGENTVDEMCLVFLYTTL